MVHARGVPLLESVVPLVLTPRPAEAPAGDICILYNNVSLYQLYFDSFLSGYQHVGSSSFHIAIVLYQFPSVLRGEAVALFRGIKDSGGEDLSRDDEGNKGG